MLQLHINNERVQNIEIIYEPRPDLRDSPLVIPLRYEGTKNILIRELNNSKKSFILFAAKEVLEEGRYEIHIKYNDKEIIDTFDVSNTEDVFWENKNKLYKNKQLLNFVRSLLFSELSRRKIKLNDVTQ